MTTHEENGADTGVPDAQGTARRIAGIPGDLGWMEVGKRRQLQEVKGLPAGTKTWTSGEVTLPVTRGTEPMRLVVREYDVIGSFSRRLTYTDVLNV